MESLKAKFSNGKGTIMTPEQKLAYDYFFAQKQAKKQAKALKKFNRLSRKADSTSSMTEAFYNSQRNVVDAKEKATSAMRRHSCGLSAEEAFYVQNKKVQSESAKEDLHKMPSSVMTAEQMFYASRSKVTAKECPAVHLPQGSSAKSLHEEFVSSLSKQHAIAKAAESDAKHATYSHELSLQDKFYASAPSAQTVKESKKLQELFAKSKLRRDSQGDGNGYSSMESFYAVQSRATREMEHAARIEAKSAVPLSSNFGNMHEEFCQSQSYLALELKTKELDAKANMNTNTSNVSINRSAKLAAENRANEHAAIEMSKKIMTQSSKVLSMEDSFAIQASKASVDSDGDRFVTCKNALSFTDLHFMNQRSIQLSREQKDKSSRTSWSVPQVGGSILESHAASVKAQRDAELKKEKATRASMTRNAYPGIAGWTAKDFDLDTSSCDSDEDSMDGTKVNYAPEPFEAPSNIDDILRFSSPESIDASNAFLHVWQPVSLDGTVIKAPTTISTHSIIQKFANSTVDAILSEAISKVVHRDTSPIIASIVNDIVTASTGKTVHPKLAVHTISTSSNNQVIVA